MKKRTLRQHAEDYFTKNDRGCTAERRCGLMQAALAVAKEDKKPIGLTEGFSFSTRGGYKGTSIVYFARSGQYAVVCFCPFCGGKLEGDAEQARTRKKADK